MDSLDSTGSLGIYISVPFCRSKCTYCNFASDVDSPANHRQYVERVCQDIRSAHQSAASLGGAVPCRVDSVYLGGGTPSALGPELMGQLWHTLRQEFDIENSAEITMECAPGQLDDAFLDAALKGGLNRVSFGVQSFVNREAAATGRLHTREIALADLRRVRSAGVQQVSVDLIAGLPHQTLASWRESLEILCTSGAGHASVYMLEVDEDSRLGRELLTGGSRYHAADVPSEELIAELYETAVAELARHGLEQYEISNFARPGCQSRHNKRYWRRQPYLGFGLDAHSHLQRPGTTGLRWQTAAILEEYLHASPSAALEARELSREEEIEESWFLGLRLREGVRWTALKEQFRTPASEACGGRTESVDCYQPVVDELRALDLLVEEEGAVRLTERGILFSNEVFSQFIGLLSSSSSPHTMGKTA